MELEYALLVIRVPGQRGTPDALNFSTFEYFFVPHLPPERLYIIAI
jgi:hypothetical protein